VKPAVRWALPSGILAAWRRARLADHIWQGAYATIGDVPEKGAGFSERRWLQEAGTWTRRLIDAHERGEPVPSDTRSIGEHRTLVATASLVGAIRGSVRVLDFGGGLGDAFVYLTHSIGERARIDYHVIELPAAVAVSAALLRGYPDVQFHSDFPALGDVDVVYANGSLQFAPDYSEVLRRCSETGARYIVLIDLPAGSGPAFATAQTNIGGSVPAWFFELREVIGILQRLGYSVIMNARAEVGYSQAGLPPERRIENFHSLICKRAR
jgi:putative methyltransferase (TIGR04325 family)